MSTECLDDFSREVVGGIPTEAQERALEELTSDGDLVCSILGCENPDCNREIGVRYCGDGELELLEGAVTGICLRRREAEEWQLKQALVRLPRSPRDAIYDGA